MNKTKSLVLILLVLTAFAPISSVKAAETLVWSGAVSSNGTPVPSIMLENLHLYRIEAKEIFWYDASNYLAADAMYYTTTIPSWVWVNYKSLPAGQSFLQINGAGVNWGPFDNGVYPYPPYTGHTYNIFYVGAGAPITFNIYDWADENYGNNYCHLVVNIYEKGESWGLTPGFWKQPQHFDHWPSIYDPYTSELQDVFGTGAPDVTLLEALSLRGGPRIDGAKEILARSATAALLNSVALEGMYRYPQSEVISLATAQFSGGTRDSILALARDFDYWNNMEAVIWD